MTVMIGESIVIASYLDKLDQVRVTTTSPDNTVAASWTARNGIRVTLGSGAISLHNEQTLAREVAAAAYSAQIGFRRACGSPRPDTVDEPRARQHAEALATVDASCVSPGGYVTARVRHDERFDISIRPGTLSTRVPVDLLTAELNAAIAATIRSHRLKSTEIARRQRRRTAATGRAARRSL
ncbi:MAG: hypothetical protein ACRD0P_30990 [Stackebrandtia sp.]